MTAASAQAVLERMEGDEAFAERVKDAGGRDASLAVLQGEGFDVTATDLRDAVLDRYGDKITPEQLDRIAGGIDDDGLAFIAGIGGGVVLAYAAASAGVV
jgi:predicted ribosomally synthesized peptide with nif11-like leader